MRLAIFRHYFSRMASGDFSSMSHRGSNGSKYSSSNQSNARASPDLAARMALKCKRMVTVNDHRVVPFIQVRPCFAYLNLTTL